MCILIPGKGILVVELKGWKEESVLRVENNDSIVIKTDDGEVSLSPQKQARGYRFSIERFVRQSIGKRPLVFQIVCLPQISKDFYKSLRMDVVLEEKFTILKEDLKNKTAFFDKLDQALREVDNWNREPFDSKTMLEVRNLFETNVEENSNQTSERENRITSSYRDYDYSRFYFMPYKIYTYEDPYKLDQTDFWEEISALPHFCGARTLVNGLKDVLGDSIKGLICTFDSFIEHEDVYKSWTDNVERRVQQYSALTTVFNQLYEKQRIDEKYRLALTQNQNHFLEAIRLFVELGIPYASATVEILGRENRTRPAVHFAERNAARQR